jgi:oxygen-independent coproporphyrinogen-3 oxidase
VTGGLEVPAAAASGVGGTRHLYVHVPFCARRCSYCDFSIAVRRRLPLEAYLRALGMEAARLRGAWRPATLYLGGGTPSKLGGEGIGRLAALLALDSPPEECTLEANPEDVTPVAAREWVRAGVTRLSLGAQSFDDGVLRWMHRTHDAAAIGAAVAAARGAGLANVSLDLIFALPDACARDWRRDLEAAIALEPDHVSLYGLTLEPRTPLFRQRARGALVPAPEPRYAEEYLEAHERLGVAGYAFYEVSNAARPGREAVHNRAYWTLAPFLGLGPSAHSFDGVARWWNEPAYARWQRQVEAGGSAVAGREVLTPEQRRLEGLYLGLRTRGGIPLPEACPPGTRAAFDRWVAQGWAVLEPEEAPATKARGGASPRLRLTPQGWLRLDELVTTI